MNSASFPLLSLLALVAACGSPQQPAPPLAGARIGAPFTLTDQNGRQLSDSAFAGRYRIVYFGYTYCPDVCPVDVQNIADGLRRFERKDAARAAKLVPIFVTVDPERDTPEVVRQFVSAFHPRMVGLTGSPDAIAKVAKSYAIYYAKRQTPGHDGYLVDHSRQAYLMDPQGKPMVLLPADRSGEAVAAELDRWVK